MLLVSNRLRSLLQDSIDAVISEIQYYFHLLPSTLAGIVPFLIDTDGVSLSSKFLYYLCDIYSL